MTNESERLNAESEYRTQRHLAMMASNDPVVGRGSVHAWVTEQVWYWTWWPTHAERVEDPIVY